MKEFKRLMEHCKSLGLEFLYFTKSGHAVYGKKNMHHTFTDSAPHAKLISPDYYKEAERTAENIRSAREVVETFVAGPQHYEDSYEFFGVHNKCSRNGIDFHEVHVPAGRNNANALYTHLLKSGSAQTPKKRRRLMKALRIKNRGSE
eukprot:gene17247-23571_t